MNKKMPYKLGRERLYNNNFPEYKGKVVKWEVLKIEQEQEIKLKFISTNSKYKQGVRSQVDSCGMLVEQCKNVYRYYCNDAGFQTNFDKLVFEIELL